MKINDQMRCKLIINLSIQLQEADGGGAFWFKCQRSTESTEPTGIESTRCQNEEGS